MRHVKRTLSYRAGISVIGDVRDVVKLPERHGHCENSVSQVMPDEHVEGRFIDVAIGRESVQRVEGERSGHAVLSRVQSSLLGRSNIGDDSHTTDFIMLLDEFFNYFLEFRIFLDDFYLCTVAKEALARVIQRTTPLRRTSDATPSQARRVHTTI